MDAGFSGLTSMAEYGESGELSYNAADDYVCGMGKMALSVGWLRLWHG